MLVFWRQLKPSERTMLTLGGGILVILILYLFILEPFMLKKDEFEIKVASQKAQVEWLKQASLEVKSLQSSQKVNNRRGAGQSLLVLVDRTAKKNKLGSALKRVEPDGTERVRVWLDNASFDDVAKWLSVLASKYQLEAESAVFDKADDIGRVNVRLVFAGAKE